MRSVKTSLGDEIKLEAESKEIKFGAWDPVPELTITSPYVHSTPTYLPWATLCQSRLYTLSETLDLASGDIG